MFSAEIDLSALKSCHDGDESRFSIFCGAPHDVAIVVESCSASFHNLSVVIAPEDVANFVHKYKGIAGLGPTDGLIKQCEFISIVYVPNVGCAERFLPSFLICLNINSEASYRSDPHFLYTHPTFSNQHGCISSIKKFQ